MSISEELKPCPFCGGDAVISRMRDESLWSHDEVEKTSVHCGACDSATAYTEEGYEVEAIELWNTRHDPAEAKLSKAIEQLQELRAVIANDSHAISFQTFGQYRTALLKRLDAFLGEAGP